MKLSTKSRYALRVMIDLAQHDGDEFISLNDVAQRQGISKNYLDQIMMLLNRDSFFISARGYKGGYKLAKPLAGYTVGDIVRATEGDTAPVVCLETSHPDCERSSRCIATEVWRGLDDAVNNYLDSVTLQDVMDKYGHLEEVAETNR